MPETQQIDFKLAVFVKKRRAWYLAVCPILDLAAQGSSPEKAITSLKNAIRGFVADCFERGVLDEVMKNAGFGPPESGLATMRERRGTRFVTVPLHLLRRGQRSSQAA
jgi:predicted RNase H-like HicB family nuclease